MTAFQNTENTKEACEGTPIGFIAAIETEGNVRLLECWRGLTPEQERRSGLALAEASRRLLASGSSAGGGSC